MAEGGRTVIIFQTFVIAILSIIVVLQKSSPNIGETYDQYKFQINTGINKGINKTGSNLTQSDDDYDEQVKILMDLWSRSLENEQYNMTSIPRPPHFQDCKTCGLNNAKLDSRGSNGEWPRWTQWKGALGLELGGHVPFHETEGKLLDKEATIQGPYPPWVEGGDEDNLPMTRRAQRDIWLHQHPKNCSASKFLIAEWQSVVAPGGFGIGAEMVALAGWLAIAMKDDRILITRNYPGAKHEGCTGANHYRWSCYFMPEASQECIDLAFKLEHDPSNKKTRQVKTNGDYNPYDCLTNFGVPTFWGKPWESTQRTAEVNGDLLGYDHVENPENRRWWRAQAFKYFFRFPSEYLCNLLNQARHHSFGEQAAKMVASRLPAEWPKEMPKEAPIEKLVWSTSGPWIPRPLVSLHVRQGDKAREMKIMDFQTYMQLCEHLRDSHPHVKDIWLATEMETVINESMSYGKSWNFYFTNIKRQTGTTTMTTYMDSLGKQKCFDNSFVNLMMAAESDFFVGALGSTWSCVIDSLRMTSGKQMAGFLSVNTMNKYL